MIIKRIKTLIETLDTIVNTIPDTKEFIDKIVRLIYLGETVTVEWVIFVCF